MHITIGPIQKTAIEQFVSTMSGAPDRIVARIAELSDGDPLVLKLYLSALKAHVSNYAELDSCFLDKTTPGLDGVFRLWFADQETLWADSKPNRVLLDELLGLTSVALGPLRKSEIQCLLASPYSMQEVNTGLRVLDRFLVGDGLIVGLSLSHPRLADYIQRELIGPAACAALKMRLAIKLKSLAAELVCGGPFTGAISPYLVRWYTSHLQADSQVTPEDYRPIFSKIWHDARIEADGSPEGFLVDVSMAIEAATHFRGSAVGFAIWSACLQASVYSSTNISLGGLFELFLEKSLLSPTRGLGHARFLRSGSLLVDVAAFLPAFERRRALEDAILLSEYSAVEALEKCLVEGLMSDAEALDRCLRSEEGWIRVLLLFTLATHCRDEIFETVINHCVTSLSCLKSDTHPPTLWQQRSTCIEPPFACVIARSQALRNALFLHAFTLSEVADRLVILLWLYPYADPSQKETIVWELRPTYNSDAFNHRPDILLRVAFFRRRVRTRILTTISKDIVCHPHLQHDPLELDTWQLFLSIVRDDQAEKVSQHQVIRTAGEETLRSNRQMALLMICDLRPDSPIPDELLDDARTYGNAWLYLAVARRLPVPDCSVILLEVFGDNFQGYRDPVEKENALRDATPLIVKCDDAVLSELWLRRAREIEDPKARALAIGSMARETGDGALAREAFQILQAIDDVVERRSFLNAAVNQIASDRVVEHWKVVARAMHRTQEDDLDELEAAGLLQRIYPDRPGPGVRRFVAWHWWNFHKKMKSRRIRKELASRLNHVGEMQGDYQPPDSMMMLAPHLTPRDGRIRKAAIESTAQIQRESRRYEALGHLLDETPPSEQSSWEAALGIAHSFKDNLEYRASTLCRIAPCLTSEAWHEAWSQAFEIYKQNRRTFYDQMLDKLSRSAPKQCLPDLFNVIVGAERVGAFCHRWPDFDPSGTKVDELLTLLKAMPKERAAVHKRLTDLLPAIRHVGGESAVEEAMIAVKQCGEWWP